MFSINKISEIKQAQINNDEIEINEDELKEMLENFSELEDQKDMTTLANPLFANPANND